MLKAQDILVVQKLAVIPDAIWSYAMVANFTYISVGEVHNSVKRLRVAHLVSDSSREVQVENLLEFLIYGLRYLFPARLGGQGHGMAIDLEVERPREAFAVWPNVTESVIGREIVPFHASVPAAAKRDAELYRLLRATEILRLRADQNIPVVVRSRATQLVKEQLQPKASIIRPSSVAKTKTAPKPVESPTEAIARRLRAQT